MNIASRDIGAGPPPYVLAELGVNHNGSLDRALELVDAAHDAGADAIKLQLFDARGLLSRAARLADYQSAAGARDPISMLEACQLSIDQTAIVAERAHAAHMHAVVTVFNLDLVEHAAAFPFDAFKVASPDVINRPLLEALVACGRPLIVSTGAATLEEVKTACDWLGAHPHLLMQCVSAYPTPDDAAQLAGIGVLRSITRTPVGYSDHTTAIDTGALAVAAGAAALEKHLTFDRFAAGPDHAASLDPPCFAEYVRLAHRARRMLGEPIKQVLDLELEVRRLSRQSIVARRELPAGHELRREDLAIKRPGTGLPPARLDSIIGRRTARTIAPDTPIEAESLA